MGALPPNPWGTPRASPDLPTDGDLHDASIRQDCQRGARGLRCAGISAGATANAQEIQLTGPLAGAPAVRQLRLHRAGRFEVSLGSSFTLLDQYLHTAMPGGTLTYHFTDWLGVGVFGGYGLQYNTGLANELQGVISGSTAFGCARVRSPRPASSPRST